MKKTTEELVFRYRAAAQERADVFDAHDVAAANLLHDELRSIFVELKERDAIGELATLLDEAGDAHRLSAASHLLPYLTERAIATLDDLSENSERPLTRFTAATVLSEWRKGGMRDGWGEKGGGLRWLDTVPNHSVTEGLRRGGELGREPPDLDDVDVGALSGGESVLNANNLEDLEHYLRDFTSWGNPDAFDFGGAVALLGACLDCLKKQAVDAELEDLEDHLSKEQVEFMGHIVDLARMRRASGSRDRG